MLAKHFSGDRVVSAVLAVVVMVVYLLTLSSGVPLWDAPEFVMAGTLLDVGHPPGAPLFWLLLRMGTMLVSPDWAAWACNVVGALCMTGAAVVIGLVARELLVWVDV